MSDDWIYVGADMNNRQWSKVGMTTRGPVKRHTSSQNPGYFIFTAYNITCGNVHEIEFNLLNYLENIPGAIRLIHVSTGRKSECFAINPFDISCLVESFIERDYPQSVQYESLTNGLSRYQCDDNVYRSFDPHYAPQSVMPDWCQIQQRPLPGNLNLSEEDYFPGNKVKYEEELGDGYFIDFETGMEFFRDEGENKEWKEWK